MLAITVASPFTNSHSSSPQSLFLAFLLAMTVFTGGYLAFGNQAWTAHSLRIPPDGRAGFTLLPPSHTGIHFTNVLAQDRHLTNQILLNGSGVAAGDVDGDDQCDLYFCALDGANRLYRNLGNWEFQDVTADAGEAIACSGQDSTGALLADIDGDGDLDLLVNAIGRGTRVFFNDGRGRFLESKTKPVLNEGRAGMSMALGDYDRDGDLDLYVANYRTVTLRDQPNTQFNIQVIDGQPTVTGINGRPLTEPDLTNRFTFNITMADGRGNFDQLEHGEADVLLRNDGQGGFEPVPFTGGAFADEYGRALTRPPFDWGLSVMFRDIDQDGHPDLYVCNDFESPDRIWINDGRGQFRAMSAMAVRQTALSSMGVDFADLDRDGRDDFIVLDMLSREHVRRFTQRMQIRPMADPPGLISNRVQSPRNTLFWNRGDGTYAEVAQFAGLDATEWSWTPVFLDVDLDGYEDLLVSNGFERDGMNVDTLRELERMKKERRLEPLEQLRLRKRFSRLDTPNLAFRNRGDMTFEEMGGAWGFHRPNVSHGIALADLDNDGDLDAVVSNLNAPPDLFRNETSAPRVAVRLRGRAPNTRGIGARVTVRGGPVRQSQEMQSGGRYLSGDDALRSFAAGPGAMEIEVRWPGGHVSRLTNAAANHLYVVNEPNPERGATHVLTEAAPKSDPPQPWFEDVSDRVRHVHREEPFDDFALQPLLDRRFSQPGPGVSWFDVDGDGWEDLLVAGGRQGNLGVWRNDTRGGFDAMTSPPFDATAPRDQTTVLGLRHSTNVMVLAGSSNYEDGAEQGGVALTYDPAAEQMRDDWPGQTSSTGPMSLADVDGDGDLDLFVGGRVVRGRYPEPATSLLFLNEEGRFHIDARHAPVFESVGLVQGSVFSDLDGDGDPDLLLACLWGPVRVFENVEGELRDRTEAWGLSSYRGWWNGVATGDFNGDGRPDIVAANWGRNTSYGSFRSRPLRIHAADLDQNGSVEAILAYRDADAGSLRPLQPFHVVERGLPLLGMFYPTYESYARATFEEIYRDDLRNAPAWEANWLETTLFLNRGGGFEARPLPVEAQLSPAFGVCVADADGDGFEDVFLSQNFFATHPEISRQDAGRGLWLRGDGRGGLSAVDGPRSGVAVYGEQRGAAVGDFDRDGRVDLAVTQNGGATRLFRNTGARPGLRVRLRGSVDNPAGVGATVRLKSAGRWGPVREIQSGSGYYAQNGAGQVMSSRATPTAIRVRWPEGQVAEQSLTGKEIEVVLEHRRGASSVE